MNITNLSIYTNDNEHAYTPLQTVTDPLMLLTQVYCIQG